MSRVGKQIIEIPSGVTVNFENGTLKITGPGGSIERKFKDEIEINITDKEITLKPTKETIFLKSLWGTYASHIKNMIIGVTDGYLKKLVIEGVGYKTELQGQDLVISVGFSHPVKIKIPEGIKVTAEKNVISISGNDKEKVGIFTAEVRRIKKPEPYKGKGIRYEDEIVKRKQGKKAIA